jgi:hypothetical protein
MKIDKNVPAPKRREPFPLDQMDIGDSIRVDSAQELKAIRNAAWNYRKANPHWDYSSAKEGDEGGRLWRIE